jgi:hypothetical protein
MIECRSPELQDLLPDYVAESLDSVAMARVRDHLVLCEACADDLIVLQVVQQARPRVAVPDIPRIVAALPVAPVGRGLEFTGPRLVRGEAAAGVPSTAPAMQPKRPAATVFRRSVWRVAATLGVVIAGSASVLVARRGLLDVPGPVTTRAVPSTDTSRTVALAPRGSESLTVATSAPSVHGVSVSYGDLGDYSEAELESMIARLDQWDGATNTEPLPGVPILPNAGGGSL